MCMEKKKLNEMHVDGEILFALSPAIFLFVKWIINKIPKKPIVRDKAYYDDPNPNNDKIYDMILHDRNFLIDLKKIIEEEGGIYDFVDSIKPRMIPGEDFDVDLMPTMGGYKGREWIKYVSGNRTHIIIDKIIDSPTVQKYIKKYKLTDDWKRVFGDTFYFVLSSSDFKKRYIELLKSVGEDYSDIVRDMTDAEKKRFFNIKDNIISLKKLLPKNK